MRLLVQVSRLAAASLAAATLPVLAASPAGAVTAPNAGPPASARILRRPASAAAPARNAAQGKRPRTVVTFAWGGGWADQLPSLQIFRKYGMHATYFIPSGLVCTKSQLQCDSSSPYLTLGDLHKIAAYGNEIGGLSVLHQNLTRLPLAEAEREVCNDRANLFRWGFHPTDFAYPYAAETAQIEQIASQCGYDGALGAGELRGAGAACSQCRWAETLPPADRMLVRAPIEVNSTRVKWTAATYESIVRNAQKHGGGWIFFTIHDICKGQCAFGTPETVLREVAAWLHGQEKNNVRVETMQQVIGGRVRAPVAGPRARPVPSPGVVNSSLTRTWAGTSDSPACFQQADYGRNQATFTWRPTGGPHGAATETVRVTGWVSGEAKLLPEMDLGACSPPVQSGRRYRAGVWYKSSRPVQLEFYYRNQVGAWSYWATSPSFPSARSWKQASWTTPAAPPGATAVSFGLTAAGTITITSTAYSLAPASSHRTLVLLGFLLFAAVAAAFIIRGQLRYKKHTRSEAALAAEESSGVSA